LRNNSGAGMGEDKRTVLQYHIVRPADEPRRQDAILQMKGQLSMADYHFRANLERLGVDPLTVATRIAWGEGTCSLVIEAPASVEVLSAALNPAVQLVGLRAERSPMSGGRKQS
jgi:hypothetical protein